MPNNSKTPIFLQGPPQSGKTYYALEAAKKFGGEYIMLNPFYSVLRKIDILQSPDYQSIIIDWPHSRSKRHQTAFAVVLREFILDGTDKHIFILSQEPPHKHIYDIIYVKSELLRKR